MKHKSFYLPLLIVVILILNSACSALNLVNSPPPPVDPPAAPAADESGDTGEVLTCFHANNYVLSFDHTLTVNEEGTSLTHILKQGGIALLSEVNSGGHDAILTTAAPQSLNFEYMGVLGPCSVEAGGTAVVSAEGYCDAGVVYINITEDWSKAEGSMTCDEAVVPFSAPGAAFTHSGASGLGEEFLITDDSGGHTVMREFLGGEGYHSWTLTMDVALVPLVDGE
ncbi:MAG: hypothetical protein MUO54_11190 [Anaerolineales bacterium]|nr:hypothetical protein [Anaerolineales bacterium]